MPFLVMTFKCRRDRTLMNTLCGWGPYVGQAGRLRPDLKLQRLRWFNSQSLLGGEWGCICIDSHSCLGCRARYTVQAAMESGLSECLGKLCGVVGEKRSTEPHQILGQCHSHIFADQVINQTRQDNLCGCSHLRTRPTLPRKSQHTDTGGVPAAMLWVSIVDLEGRNRRTTLNLWRLVSIVLSGHSEVFDA